MKKAAIYTRTGDQGSTSLIGGIRVEKDHPRVEAYGTLDELNAHLGLLIKEMDTHAHKEIVENIINNIFTISCYLAHEVECNSPINQQDIVLLEEIIDHTETALQPLRGFLLPGGNSASLQANLCRTVCRRAERRIITLSHTEKTDASIIAYINRLSDYLFSLSRLLNDKEEKFWRKLNSL